MIEVNGCMSIREAQRILGLSGTWIRKLIDEGRLHAVRVNGDRVLDAEAVHRLAAERAEKKRLAAERRAEREAAAS